MNVTKKVKLNNSDAKRSLVDYDDGEGE